MAEASTSAIPPPEEEDFGITNENDPENDLDPSSSAKEFTGTATDPILVKKIPVVKSPSATNMAPYFGVSKTVMTNDLFDYPVVKQVLRAYALAQARSKDSRMPAVEAVYARTLRANSVTFLAVQERDVATKFTDPVDLAAWAVVRIRAVLFEADDCLLRTTKIPEFLWFDRSWTFIVLWRGHTKRQLAAVKRRQAGATDTHNKKTTTDSGNKKSTTSTNLSLLADAFTKEGDPPDETEEGDTNNESDGIVDIEHLLGGDDDTAAANGPAQTGRDVVVPNDAVSADQAVDDQHSHVDDTTGVSGPPRSRHGKLRPVILPPAFTTNPDNPRASWFFEGQVIGGGHVVDVYRDYNEVDWVDNNLPNPSFDPAYYSGTKSHERKLVSHNIDIKQAIFVDAQQATAHKAEILKSLRADEAEFEVAKQKLASCELNGLDEDTLEIMRANLKTAEDKYIIAQKTVQADKDRIHRLNAALTIARASWDKLDVETIQTNRSLLTELIKGKVAEAAEFVEPREGSRRDNHEDPSMILATSPDDVEFRRNYELAAKYLTHPDFEPDDYRRALSILGVKNRSRPWIPGMAAAFLLLWWQVIAGARFLQQMTQFPKDKYAPLGAWIADETGIGKTMSMLVALLAYNNNRKVELQHLHDSKDWDALAKYPPPKPTFFVTLPHLVAQTAREIASFSPWLQVMVYGGSLRSHEDFGSGIQNLIPSLTLKNEIFDQSNELTSQIIVVMSYQTLAIRNGPNSLGEYLKKTHNMSAEQIKSTGLHQQPWKAQAKGWPGYIRGGPGLVICDEVHFTKGQYANTSFALRWLGGRFHCMASATPQPWSHNDILGPLSLVANPKASKEYKDLVSQSGGSLRNPYELDQKGNLVHPELAKYIPTVAAFETHVSHLGLDDAYEVGRALNLVFRNGMRGCPLLTRRTYNSECVVHPDPNVPKHRIGDALPPTTCFRVQVKYSRNAQIVFDAAAKELAVGKVVDDTDKDNRKLYTANPRMLNVASSLPLLLFVPEIHQTRVDNDKGILDESGNPKKVVNPYLEMLQHLYEQNNRESDKAFIFALSDRMYENMRDSDDWIQYLPSPEWRRPSASDPPRCVMNILKWWLGYSPRFRIMVTALAEQVVKHDEKALVFFVNPFEQLLFTVILRLLGIRASAVLSSASSKKDCSAARLFEIFNKPLRRWRDPFAVHPGADEIEVLVLSYYMSAGANLQPSCHNWHGVVAPSEPLRVQSMGRIVRFGQKFACKAIEYVVLGTHNEAQVECASKHALSSLAAMMADVFQEREDEAEVSRQEWFVLNDVLYDPASVTERVRSEGRKLSGYEVIARLQVARSARVVNAESGEEIGQHRFEAVRAQPVQQKVPDSAEAKKTPKTPARAFRTTAQVEADDESMRRELQEMDISPLQHRTGGKRSAVSNADENSALRSSSLSSLAPSPRPAAKKRKTGQTAAEPSKSKGDANKQKKSGTQKAVASQLASLSDKELDEKIDRLSKSRHKFPNPEEAVDYDDRALTGSAKGQWTKWKNGLAMVIAAMDDAVSEKARRESELDE